MIRQMKIRLTAEGGAIPNWFWSYNLYGALFEKLDTDFVEELHSLPLTPMSQYLTTKRGEKDLLWTVNLLGRGGDCIGNVLRTVTEFAIENHGIKLKVEDFSEVQFAEEEFAKGYLSEKPRQRFVALATETPAAFKSGGEYVFFPTGELIMKSAIKKWNTFAQKIVIDDENAEKHLIESAKICSYRLKSVNYHIKGVKIPSFFGEFVIFINGPEPLVRLANMLLGFLPFSGMGIKSALGMGGVTIKERKSEMKRSEQNEQLYSV